MKISRLSKVSEEKVETDLSDMYDQLPKLVKLTNDDEAILNKLIDSYENSVLYKGESKRDNKIYFKFAPCFSISSSILSSIEEQSIKAASLVFSSTIK